MLNALGYTLADNNKRFAESEKFIRKALILEPNNPAIIDSLGWVLYKTGRYKEALNELCRAYSRLKDPEVISHIIEVLVVLDKYNEANQIFKYAEKSLPKSELIKNVRNRYFTETP
jgi:Flp pilus assembly protein TadD